MPCGELNIARQSYQKSAAGHNKTVTFRIHPRFALAGPIPARLRARGARRQIERVPLHGLDPDAGIAEDQGDGPAVAREQDRGAAPLQARLQRGPRLRSHASEVVGDDNQAGADRVQERVAQRFAGGGQAAHDDVGLEVCVTLKQGALAGMAQLGAEEWVSLYYMIPGEFLGLCLSGRARSVPEARAELWVEGWERYYPAGPGDPDYSVLRVDLAL